MALEMCGCATVMVTWERFPFSPWELRYRYKLLPQLLLYGTRDGTTKDVEEARILCLFPFIMNLGWEARFGDFDEASHWGTLKLRASKIYVSSFACP